MLLLSSPPLVATPSPPSDLPRRRRSGLPALPASAADGRLIMDRGLDSLGTTPLGGRSSEDDAEMEE